MLFLKVDLTYQDRRLLREIEVLVAVKDKTLNNIFTLVVTCMVIINTVNMGGQLDLDVIKAVFKKPIGPAVGFCSQFLLMPLVKRKEKRERNSHAQQFPKNRTFSFVFSIMPSFRTALAG